MVLIYNSDFFWGQWVNLTTKRQKLVVDKLRGAPEDNDDEVEVIDKENPVFCVDDDDIPDFVSHSV